jgi:hypothetical protein
MTLTKILELLGVGHHNGRRAGSACEAFEALGRFETTATEPPGT